MESKTQPSVEALFQQALEHDPAARTAFLAEACGGDSTLLDEVTQLLSAHESAGEFLNDSPAPPALSNLSNQPPQIPGFKIERPLGQGGVGAVYEAFDEKLQRRVAVKVLSNLNAEPARRRILAEARNA